MKQAEKKIAKNVSVDWFYVSNVMIEMVALFSFTMVYDWWLDGTFTRHLFYAPTWTIKSG